MQGYRVKLFNVLFLTFVYVIFAVEDNLFSCLDRFGIFYMRPIVVFVY